MERYMEISYQELKEHAHSNRSLGNWLCYCYQMFINQIPAEKHNENLILMHKSDFEKLRNTSPSQT